jgi:hypothetical protein
MHTDKWKAFINTPLGLQAKQKIVTNCMPITILSVIVTVSELIK